MKTSRLVSALILCLPIGACKQLDETTNLRSGGLSSLDGTGRNGDLGDLGDGTEGQGENNVTPDQGGEKEDTTKLTLKEYDPHFGDVYKSTDRSKTWKSGQDEPADWAQEKDNSREVVGLYEDGARCKYRVKYEGGVELDLSCGEEFSCSKPTSDCSTEGLDEKVTVANYKDLTGTITKCRNVMDVAGTKMLTYSETKAWFHNDILIEGRLAKSATRTCSVTLKANEDYKKVDACDPGDDREVSFSVSESTFKEQTAGSGEKVLKEFKGAFTASGGLKIEGDSTEPLPYCSLLPDFGQGAQISISLGKAFCLDGQRKNESIAFTAPVRKATEQALAAVSASIDKTPLVSMMNTNCKLNLEGNEEEGALSGTVNCTGDFKSPVDMSQTGKVEGISFRCKAPDDFDWSGF